jgi:hypothetical protein
MPEQESNRVLARSIARELTPEELTEVSGGSTSYSQATSVPSGDIIPSYPDDTTVYGC